MVIGAVLGLVGGILGALAAPGARRRVPLNLIVVGAMVDAGPTATALVLAAGMFALAIVATVSSAVRSPPDVGVA